MCAETKQDVKVERLNIDEWLVTIDGDAAPVWDDEHGGCYCWKCSSWNCQHARALWRRKDD